MTKTEGIYRRIRTSYTLSVFLYLVVVAPLFLVLWSFRRAHERHTETQAAEARSLLVSISSETTAICRAGWHSCSLGRGTCSHHGGVRHYTWLLRLTANEDPLAGRAAWLRKYAIILLLGVSDGCKCPRIGG